MIVIISLFVGQVIGQEFKGHIEYEIKVIKTDSTFTDDEFLKGFGDKSTFYYNDGSYFQQGVNSAVEFTYLDTGIKQLGLKYKSNDTLYLFDATKAGPMQLIKTEKKSMTKEILGYKCLGIDFHGRNIFDGYDLSISLYYSEDIKINGERFEGIKIEFYDEIYQTLNSIPLGIEATYPIFSVHYSAIKIVKNDAVLVSELIQNNSKGLIVKKIN
ncbi:hypothetical protein ACFLRU_07655 [Bacteroidota bacterium]